MGAQGEMIAYNTETGSKGWGWNQATLTNGFGNKLYEVGINAFPGQCPLYLITFLQDSLFFQYEELK